MIWPWVLDPCAQVYEMDFNLFRMTLQGVAVSFGQKSASF